MFKKNPDLIDKYLHLSLWVSLICFWIFYTIWCSVIMWGCLTVEYVNYYFDLFTAIDFVELMLISTLWCISIAQMGCSVCNYIDAYRSFMES